MKNHLSTTQLSERIAGGRIAEIEQHLLECAVCRNELKAFESGLSALGESVRCWAAQQNAGPNLRIRERTSSRRASLRWALAGVAMGGIVFLPLLRSTQAQREATLQEDAELLQHIDSQLSRAVPATMEPLMNLMRQGQEEHE